MNYNDFMRGVMFGGGSGGGASNGITSESIDYVHFTGASGSCFQLPLTVSADHLITVDFEPDEYINYMVIYGTTLGAAVAQLTQYGGRYYTSNGTSEVNWEGALTGRHVFEMNKNGYNYFDNVQKNEYTPTTYNNGYYIIAARTYQGTQQGVCYKGKMYGFNIKSIATDENICNLVPKKLSFTSNEGLTFNTYGLFDTIGGNFYTAPGLIGGNDNPAVT